MENVIIEGRLLPRAVADLLPARMVFAIESSGMAVEEIRIRREKGLWICGEGKNRLLDFKADGEMLDEILLNACGGSLYSSAESIKRGYVFAGDGIRIGVCGEWTSGGVRNITSLAIRIPRRVRLEVGFVRELLEGFKMSRGLLIFSPPLGGKTSFLRETARALSTGVSPLSVVVVDTRGELEYSLEGELCVDILSRYPRREGIEIALRTLGAQAVICDEIGAGDADAICELHGGGVPLIASAHASGLSDLLSRRGIDVLHKSGVFGAYIELLRGQDPSYKIYMREDCLDF